MTKSAAEAVRQARIDTRIMNGSSNLYVQDQQRFYCLLTLMLGPKIKSKLKSINGLGKPNDADCGSALFDRIYLQMVNRWDAAKKARFDDAVKAMSAGLFDIRDTWDDRKLIIVDRMATHETIGEPFPASKILYCLNTALYN